MDDLLIFLTVFLIVFLIVYFLVLIPLVVLLVIAEVRVFKKAGQPGWAAIVPGFGIYVMYKIARLKRPLLHTIVYCVYLTTVVTVLTVASTIAALKSGRSYEPMKLAIYTYIFELPLIVLNFISGIKLSKSFGHGVGFGIGLNLLSYLFYPILGFGKSRYIYGIEKKTGSGRDGGAGELPGDFGKLPCENTDRYIREYPERDLSPLVSAPESDPAGAEDGYCTNCGAFLKAGVRFCPNCGKKRE